MSRPDFLESRIAELTSPDPEPRRACPSCGNPRPVLGGLRVGPFGPLPRYFCGRCNLRYSRLTGTPLSRMHLDRETFLCIVGYLKQSLAVRVVASDLGIGEANLARIVRELRAWLLELDPSGREEAKVQLGGLIQSPRRRDPRKLDAADIVLTRVIDRTVNSLRSRRDTPVPAQCPHCGSSNVSLRQSANQHAPQPTYRCSSCRRNFTRLTGTPLARSRFPDKQRAFVRYLGVPMLLTEVADRLEVDYGTVRDWRQRYSELAAQIDPSGALLERIQLAPALAGEPCGYCGRTDALSWDESRRWHCAGCGRFFSHRRHRE